MIGPDTSYEDHACEWSVADAVSGVGLAFAVLETIGKQTRTWRAAVPIQPVMYDGLWPHELPAGDLDRGNEPPSGRGRTRADALTDLRRALTRITYGVIGRDTDGDGLVAVAWDGRRLVQVPWQAGLMLPPAHR